MPALSMVPAPAPPASPLRAIAMVAFAIFALGTALYAIGVNSWSGQRVASLDVRREVVVPLPGATWTRAQRRAPEVGPVHLDPAMNPVRVLAHVNYEPRPGHRMSCRVALMDADGNKVWLVDRGFGSGSAGASAGRSATTTVVLETFAVPREADYTMIVAFDTGVTNTIRSASLEVRRQVASLQLWFVVMGSLLALASFVVVLFSGPRSALVSGRDSRAA